MFDKHESFLLEGDSLGLIVQQLIFDVEELQARWARAEVLKWDKVGEGAYGMTHIMFYEIRERTKERRSEIIAQIVKEVYLAPEPDALEKWRLLIDELLLMMNDFATTPEDAARFISGAPLDKRYILAPTLITGPGK